MSFKALWLLGLTACFYNGIDAQMIVQSCVRDITVSGLSGSISYPTGDNEFYITITLDSDHESVNTTKATFSSGSASMPQEICFNFDTSVTTTTVSYHPTRGQSIRFDIMGNGNTYGRVSDSFPNPSNGSIKSSFSAETHSINKGGTITYNIYHQISTENVYLKIANRNFNVYRRCFELKKLCIFKGGIEDPIYPTDCIDNTLLKPEHITLKPPDSAYSANPIDDILDDNDTTIWSAPSPPTLDDVPIGTDLKNCWAPYAQYIIINLAEMNISAFSSISLGFTQDPSFNHSGDSDPTSKAPPRWITFAFDSNVADLKAFTSDILTDQYWAVDLRDGNFGSDGNAVWNINPLYFQLDTNPQHNTFRMTQITKGFGLQYLSNASLEYRSSPATTGWNTYTAAYIQHDVINTVDASDPDYQVKELADVACRDIFPTSSPAVFSADQSDTYNNCWDYATDQSLECYETTNPENHTSPDVFYPPVAYSIVGFIGSVYWGWNAQKMHYCVENPLWISTVDDWSGCNVTDLDGELKRCMLDASVCDRDIDASFALPMGWECQLPPTPEPTTDPTRYPTNDPTIDPTVDPTVDPTNDPTADPTTSSPTSAPTSDPTQDPTNDPTTDPTLDPTIYPTIDPTVDPTTDPTNDPTSDPTTDPTLDPTTDPTRDPTFEPTVEPTHDPTTEPTTAIPSTSPTLKPSTSPTKSPTEPEGQVHVDTTIASDLSGIGKEDTDDDQKGTTLPMHWIIIGVCVAVCCCGLLIGFICYRQKDKEEQNDFQDKSLAEVVSVVDVQTAGDEATLQMVATKVKEKKSEPSDSGTAGYYEKGDKHQNTDDDMAEDSQDHEHDDIYAKGRQTVSADINRNNNDELVLAEHEGHLDDLKLTEKGANVAVLNKKVSLEGGDPVVTGAITKDAKDEAVVTSSEDDSADAAGIYGKGHRGKSRGGHKKEDSDSDANDETEKLYGKGKRGKSRGGPKKKNVEQNSDSDSDSVGNYKGKKKLYKEEAGVVYGDPVVTAMESEQAEGDSTEEEPVLQDEFDENEQYKM